MKFKHLALSAAVLLFTMSTASNADSFEPKAVSAGVEYRVSFGGSTRAKPPAPTFGFNVNVTRAQSGPGFDFAAPTLSYTENKYNKLLDVRFDANTKELHSMHVNGVDVLYDTMRLNVDPATVDLKVKTANINHGLALAAALGVAVADNMAQDDSKKNKITPDPAPTPAPVKSCPTLTFSNVSYVLKADSGCKV